jgi:hypothetical protein
MAIPSEEQGGGENRHRIVHLGAAQKVTRCLNEWSRLPQRLPESSEQGHVLTRRPHSPLSDPEQDLVVLKPTCDLACERDLFPGVDWIPQGNLAEMLTHRGCWSSIHVGFQDRVVALPAPRCALAVAQESHQARSATVEEARSSALDVAASSPENILRFTVERAVAGIRLAPLRLFPNINEC